MDRVRNMYKHLVALFSFWLLALAPASIVQAQQAGWSCPAGIPIGSPLCKQVTTQRHADGSSGAGRWIKTWGALGSGENSGGASTVTGAFSKKDAEQEVLELCEKKGGEQCQVRYTYFNQCVAIAQTDRNGGGSAVGSAISIESASRVAKDKCRSIYSKECLIVLSECSEPVLMSD